MPENSQWNLPVHFSSFPLYFLLLLIHTQSSELSEQMWGEEPVRAAFLGRAKASHVQILSATPYYLENATRFAQPDYLPSDKDVTLAKLRTSGIIETHFELQQIPFTLIDVGGQKNEQRKWLHCFENVSAVIYLVALDEFDMTLEEDNTTNRFTASLKLFMETTGLPWFNQNLCLLFLNKKDLFEEKIKTYPLNGHFPEVPKNATLEDCLDFMKRKYEDSFQGSTIQTFTTCAVDKENCKRVFESIKESVLLRAVETSGISIGV